MIEIICNQEDEDKKKKISDDAKKPKNIKQIGEVNSNKKIYIEDYAYTYIASVAKQVDRHESAGILLGECQMRSGETLIFIKGVVKAKMPGDEICFDKEVWDRIYEETDKFFPGLNVVGWYAIMPESNQERMMALRKIHIDNFAGGLKTLYLINNKEKESAFYLYERNELKKQSGFVCFYERNCEMQEYMLEKREKTSCEESGTDEVMKNIRKKIEEKKHTKQKYQIQVNVYAAGAVVVLAMLITGINMFNSNMRINKFDKSLTDIAKEISNLSDNAKETESDVVMVNNMSGGVYPKIPEKDGQTDESGLASGKSEATAGEKDDKGKSGEKAEDNQGAGEVTPEKDHSTADGGVPEENQNTDDGEANGKTEQEETKDKDFGGDSDEQVWDKEGEGAGTGADYDVYTVESGDTLISICKKIYGNLDKYNALIQINNLQDINYLYVGQEIKLP